MTKPIPIIDLVPDSAIAVGRADNGLIVIRVQALVTFITPGSAAIVAQLLLKSVDRIKRGDLPKTGDYPELFPEG